MKKLKLSFIGLDFDDELENSNSVEQKTNNEEDVKFEKQTKENVNSGGQNVTIPLELLTDLTDMAKKKSGESSDEKWEKMLSQLTGAIKDTSEIDNRFLGQRPIPYEEVDKDDILETPAFFFAHSVSKTLFDDYRQGSAIQIPYGRPVKFKTISRVLTQSHAKNPSFLTVSAAVIYSKKVANWIRNHTEFNINIFEKISDGKDITAAMAEKLSIAFNMVSQMSEHEVGAACAREGIAINTMDFSELRRKLATNRAKRMMQHEAEVRGRSTKDLENFFQGKVDVVQESGGSVAATRSQFGKVEDMTKVQPVY